MPAIDVAMPTPLAAPSASAEVRPSGQTPAASAKAGEKANKNDTQASDAFIAALLAQSTLPQAKRDLPTPLTEGGQDLPAMRPTLAIAGASCRDIISTAADTPSAALPGGTEVDGAQDDFANAFAALQDAMTGRERGAQTDGEGAASSGTTAMLSDLGSNGAAHGSHPGADTIASQVLDALTGAHAARAHEAPAQVYAAKPAALPMDQPTLFAERLDQHISFMIGDQVQSAQIAVTPADLGPVEVRVTLVGDEAKIQLSAVHAATREALNDALPRLRASFADAGISLSQAGVFAQMPERQPADSSFSGQPAGGEREFDHAPLAAVASARSMRVGLIDAFV